MTSGGFFDDPVDTAARAASFVGGAAALGIGVINAKAIEATKAETQKLIAEAKSGGFRISEEGMTHFEKAIDKMSQEVTALSQSMDYLTQAPKLGSHAYGHAVASHDQKSAANELGSASVVLRQFQEVLGQAREALQRAAGVYKGTEEGHQSTFNNQA